MKFSTRFVNIEMGNEESGKNKHFEVKSVLPENQKLKLLSASGCFQKLGYPKMDGENNGKPYEQMDDLGVPLFLETPI